jgi:oligosaccharyltransferase complex subunit beta
VVKVTNMRHNKVGIEYAGVNPENYRIKDDIEFFVDVQEKKPDGTFVPYIATDIQLEFRRLDPQYRLTLEQKCSKSATYSTALKVPDMLGVSKMSVVYNRYGFTFIDEEIEVSVIQFRHDEFPRFLTIAFPYYTNVFLVMGACFTFIVFFLYSDYSRDKGVVKEKQ